METKKNQINEDENIWTEECEELLAEWSEKASCYRWLHGRCEKSYRHWYYCFSIPVIILSTLTGAANVGMDSFVPEENKSIASAIVGGVNIFAGIVSTLQNFLKVAELMEAHRIAGVSWGKLQRNIAIELALDPSRRVIQSDFLKLSRAEYDRLIEAGPIIDDKVILQFNKKFKNYEVSIPSICNGLDKCNIYKIDENIKMNPSDFIDEIEDIISDEEKINTKKKRDTINRPILSSVEVKGNRKENEKENEKENGKENEKGENNIADNNSINIEIIDNTNEDEKNDDENEEVPSLNKDTQTIEDETKEDNNDDDETQSFLKGIDEN